RTATDEAVQPSTLDHIRSKKAPYYLMRLPRVPIVLLAGVFSQFSPQNHQSGPRSTVLRNPFGGLDVQRRVVRRDPRGTMSKQILTVLEAYASSAQPPTVCFKLLEPSVGLL